MGLAVTDIMTVSYNLGRKLGHLKVGALDLANSKTPNFELLSVNSKSCTFNFLDRVLLVVGGA